MSLYSRLIICLSLIHHCKSVKVRYILPTVEAPDVPAKCTLTAETDKGDIFYTRAASGEKIQSGYIELDIGQKISYKKRRHAVTLTCEDDSTGTSPWKDLNGYATTDGFVADTLNEKLEEIRSYRKTHVVASTVLPEYLWPTIQKGGVADWATLERVEPRPPPLSRLGSGGSSTSSVGSIYDPGTGATPGAALDAAPIALPGRSTPGGGKTPAAHENYYDLMDDYYYDLEVEEARQKRAMSRLQRQKRAISRLQRQRKHARARKSAAKSRRFRYKSYN